VPIVALEVLPLASQELLVPFHSEELFRLPLYGGPSEVEGAGGDRVAVYYYFAIKGDITTSDTRAASAASARRSASSSFVSSLSRPVL